MNRHHNLRYLLLAIVLNLVACAQPLPYQRPLGSDAATVSLTNQTRQGLRAREAHREDCKGPSEFGDVQVLIKPGETRATTVRGNEFLSLNLTRVRTELGLPYSVCPTTFGFRTRSAGRYHIDYVEAPDGCTAVAKEQIDGRWVPLKLTALNYGATSCYPTND